jgi:HSP20 family protein
MEMERMRRQMDALSGMLYRRPERWREASAGVFPLINLTEDENNYLVRAELPGMKAEDLDIQILDKSLTISGERKILSEGEGATYHRRERDAGKFSRVIGLPGEVDGGKADARMINGLLTVVIPKAAAAKPRQIAIK